jgi:hypothetical protein
MICFPRFECPNVDCRLPLILCDPKSHLATYLGTQLLTSNVVNHQVFFPAQWPTRPIVQGSGHCYSELMLGTEKGKFKNSVVYTREIDSRPGTTQDIRDGRPYGYKTTRGHVDQGVPQIRISSFIRSL